MRILLCIAALAAISSAAEAQQTWIAACYGQDSQYTQTIGGTGYFHVSAGDGTYDTQKLKQTYYNGDIVCGAADSKAPLASSHVGEVCANRKKNIISVMYLDQMAKGLSPANAETYCDARITVVE